MSLPTRKLATQYPGYGVVVYWGGEKVRFLTALEVKSRAAWVKLVPSFSSLQAKTFLQEVLNKISYPVHTIHTDNGSEFDALFDQAVVQLAVTHLWSPPRTPKVHSHIERFNGVIQQEFIDESLLNFFCSILQ